MSDRFSEIILLCEDDGHAMLVKWYLKECGLKTASPNLRVRTASRVVHGGNITWVLEEFPKELPACRNRNLRARTLLIVVIDSDNHEVEDRRGHLRADPPVSDADQVVVLIPKRHVETWIRAALGQTVDEIEDCKRPTLDRSEIRMAAKQIYDWARDNPMPGPTCVPSLHAAFPEWRKIR